MRYVKSAIKLAIVTIVAVVGSGALYWFMTEFTTISAILICIGLIVALLIGDDK